MPLHIQSKGKLNFLPQKHFLFQAPHKLLKILFLQTLDAHEKMLDREKLKAIYLIWNKPWMAAGKGTFIDHLLQRCGFENLITEFRYPEVTIAEMEQADIVLLSSEPFPFNPKHVTELEQSGLKNVFLTDGEMWSWYGSRLVKAVKYLEQFRLGL